MMKLLINGLLLSLVLLGPAEADYNSEFTVCPKSYPNAFDHGRQCCSQNHRSDRGTSMWSRKTCRGRRRSCPGRICESHSDHCTAKGSSGYTWVQLRGFNRELNGEYEFRYFEGAYEANQPIFKHKKNDNCIWWHRRYRHWWVGSCENVGTNAGYAYIDPDYECPVTSDRDVWRRGGSDQLIRGTEVSSSAVLASGASEVKEQSGTVGLNAVIRNGRYKQNCRFRLVAGRWRCVNVQ